MSRPAKCDDQLELNRFQRIVLRVPTTVFIAVIMAGLAGIWYAFSGLNSSDFYSYGGSETTGSEAETVVDDEADNDSSFAGLQHPSSSEGHDVTVGDIHFNILGEYGDTLQVIATVTNHSENHVAQLKEVALTALSSENEHKTHDFAFWEFLIPPGESAMIVGTTNHTDFEVQELAAKSEPEVEWLEPTVPVEELTVTLHGIDTGQATVRADSVTYTDDSVEIAVDFESSLPRRNTENVVVNFVDDAGDLIPAEGGTFEWDYAWIPEGESVRHITVSTEYIPENADLEKTEFHLL